jgi:hypothetical protein
LKKRSPFIDEIMVITRAFIVTCYEKMYAFTCQMDPKFIIYIATENVTKRAPIIKTLTDLGFNAMISATQPTRRDLDGCEGIIFNETAKGFLASEYPDGTILGIVWWHCPMDKKDIQKLIPYFEALLIGAEFQFNYEDRLLIEFTNPPPTQKAAVELETYECEPSTVDAKKRKL